MRRPRSTERLGRREDVLVGDEFAPVDRGELERLGRAAQVDHAHLTFAAPPGAFARFAAGAFRVQGDADLTACHVVGTAEERSVLGIQERRERP